MVGPREFEYAPSLWFAFGLREAWRGPRQLTGSIHLSFQHTFHLRCADHWPTKALYHRCLELRIFDSSERPQAEQDWFHLRLSPSYFKTFVDDFSLLFTILGCDNLSPLSDIRIASFKILAFLCKTR